MVLAGWPFGIELVSFEALVTEQFEPVGVRLAGEQFAGAAVGSLGSFAAQEASVVEEELQQLQVVGTEMAAQKEVTA